MHIAEVVTIAKSLPLLRLNTYKSLILSYSADYRRIFAEKAAREQAAAEENPTSTDATDALTAEAETLPVQADEQNPESFDTEVKEETAVTEKYDDVERIIAEAEEAAFQLTEETETDSEETKITT